MTFWNSEKLATASRGALAGCCLVGMIAAGTVCACEQEKAIAPGNKSTIPTDADAMVHSEGPRIVDPNGAPLKLRCVNVDSWLIPIPYLVSDSGNALFISSSEFVGRLDDVVGAQRAGAFWDEWRDNFITEGDFERMAALGFNCARLVIYHRAITTEAGGQYTLLDDRLRYIDKALEWGLAHGVYVVLDLHTAPGGQNGVATVSDVPSTDPVPRLFEGPTAEANQQATISIWRGLAERYRDNVVVAGYDLLNEPAVSAQLPPNTLPDLVARITSAIRSVDSDHMIIVEGDGLAQEFSMFSAPLDANMTYEFHAYALTGFEPWTNPDQKLLQPYTTLRAEHDRPLWLGEFGENTQEWQVKMIGLMEANDIGWALFPWKRKMTLFWNPVLQMIQPTPKWYELASYLAQPADGTMASPSASAAEEGMAEILSAMKLANCTEDGALANAILQ